MIVTNSRFEDEKMHDKTARLLKILGDPNRIKIVKLLAKGELCQCEIIPIIGQSQPTVSRHLRLLEENGILFSRKDGVKTLYRIADPNTLKIVDLAASIGRM
jgi:ArsR family transcriptional regulator